MGTIHPPSRQEKLAMGMVKCQYQKNIVMPNIG